MGHLAWGCDPEPPAPQKPTSLQGSTSLRLHDQARPSLLEDPRPQSGSNIQEPRGGCSLKPLSCCACHPALGTSQHTPGDNTDGSPGHGFRATRTPLLSADQATGQPTASRPRA